MGKQKARLAVVLGLVAAIGLLHYSCQFYLVQHTQFHIVFHKLFYIPIILAAYWWGLKGGAWIGFSCAAIYVVDVFRWWNPAHANHLSRISEIFLFIGLGILLGTLVDRDRRSKAAKQLAEQRAKAARRTALTDPLTKAYNRRSLDAKLHEFWQAAQQGQRTFSLLMIDLNNFKQINDRFGHPAGDRVLYATVQTLFNNTRKTDLVFRYGGDEFLLILPDTRVAQAMELATRLRQEVAKLSFKGAAKESFSTDFSIGVLEYRPDLADIHAMLSKLDEALYRAKKDEKKITLAG